MDSTSPIEFLTSGSMRSERSLTLKAGARSLCCVNDELWCASRDGSIHIRQWSDGALRRRLRAKKREFDVPLKFFVTSIDYDGLHTVWMASSDGTLRAFDLKTRAFSFECRRPHAPVSCVRVVDDTVWVARDGGALTIRDSSTGRALQRVVETSAVTIRDLCPVGNDMWAAADDGIRIWDRRGPFRTRLSANESRVTSLCGVGSRIWSGSADGRICIWDVPSRNLERVLLAHANAIVRLRLVDAHIWSLCLDGVLRIWDELSGDCRLVVKRCERVLDIAVDENCSDSVDGISVWLAFRNPPTLHKLSVNAPKRLSSRFESARPVDGRGEISSTVYEAEMIEHEDQPTLPRVPRVNVRLSHESSTKGPAEVAQEHVAGDDIQAQLECERRKNVFLQTTLDAERESYETGKDAIDDIRALVQSLRDKLSLSDHTATEQDAREKLAADWAHELARTVCDNKSLDDEVRFLSAMRDTISSLKGESERKKAKVMQLRQALVPQKEESDAAAAMNEPKSVPLDEVIQERKRWENQEGVWQATILGLQQQLQQGPFKLARRLNHIESELEALGAENEEDVAGDNPPHLYSSVDLGDFEE